MFHRNNRKSMLSELTIKEYLAKTAGSDSVPAGGAAAAINAALAASLTEKIAAIILSKNDDEEVKSYMEAMIERMQILRDEFTECIDRDTDAYNELCDAYKMPEKTNEDKVSRDEQIQKSILIAAMVPFDIAEMAMRMMDFIIDVAKNADQRIASDLCVAISSARSAVVGGFIIARVNLSLLKSKQIANELTKKSDEIESEALLKEKELFEWFKALK